MKWQVILIVVLWTLGSAWLRTNGAALNAFQLAILGWVGGLVIHQITRKPGEVWRWGPRQIPEVALKFVAGFAASVAGVSIFVGVFGPGVWMSPADAADRLRLTGGVSGDAGSFSVLAVAVWDLGLAVIGATVVVLAVALTVLVGQSLVRRIRRQPDNKAAAQGADNACAIVRRAGDFSDEG